MYTIYKATNKINGHSYIGFTSKWPQRIESHRWAAMHDSHLVFHNAGNSVSRSRPQHKYLIRTEKGIAPPQKEK